MALAPRVHRASAPPGRRPQRSSMGGCQAVAPSGAVRSRVRVASSWDIHWLTEGGNLASAAEQYPGC